MNEKGGINDDCIITKVEDNSFFMVINAGCKDKDLEYMRYHKSLGDWKNRDVAIIYNEDNSLIAVQGPKAQKALDSILKSNLSDMDFMTSKEMKFDNQTIRVSRCGYTGEDGFEVSVPERSILNFVTALGDLKE